MDRKQIISTIFIATIIGMLFGLVVRLKREKIPFKMYFYVSMVLITDIFIYPLFFPLFFKKKVYALYKSNEIIGKLKEHNINTKKINEIKKSIRRNKRIILRNKFTILWFKIIINILEFMLSFKGMHNVLKISIINSQIEIDNSTQFDALKRAY